MDKPIKEENNESISIEEFEYEKKQWRYRTIAYVAVLLIMVIILTATITYYIAVGNKYNNLYNAVSDSDTDEEEIIESSDAIYDIYKTLTSFAEVIDENYIGEINKTDLINSTIKGFVEGIGDEYSEYMTAEEWEEYQESALGNYVGVGIYMTLDDDDNVIVVSTISGTPAEEAGIQSEDIITAVDGESVIGMTTTEVSNRVKGEEGTSVAITVYRDGDYLDFTLERKSIKVYHVETEMLDDNIGYISLLTFDEECSEEFETGMDELIEQGAEKIIFDLRYNTGGLVEEALNIIDLFVDEGEEILIEVAADGTETINTAESDKKYDIEIVILVNEYTASASEIVTGALKDYGIATVVGTTTYGKGVIQNVYSLSDGSVLKLTTAEYYTPNRNQINKVGIEPDYEIEIDEENLDDEGNIIDTQLEKAKELLTN